jgi:hypothetical protein
MSIKGVTKATNLNVCGGIEAEQSVLDFVFFQLTDELPVGHAVVLRETERKG